MHNKEFDVYEAIGYFAALKILLRDECVAFSDGPIANLTVEGRDGDWDSLRQLITRVGATAPMRLTADEADHDEVFDLLCRVYEQKQDGTYSDLGEFLGYEIS